MKASTKHPTSPHLQIYRLPLTALLSISHRICGFILAIGSLLLVTVLYAAAEGPTAYQFYLDRMRSWFGQLLLVGYVFALYLHLSNGIRHLFWDIGKGFELETVDLTAKIAIGSAVVLTAITFLIARIG